MSWSEGVPLSLYSLLCGTPVLSEKTKVTLCLERKEDTLSRVLNRNFGALFQRNFFCVVCSSYQTNKWVWTVKSYQIVTNIISVYILIFFLYDYYLTVPETFVNISISYTANLSEQPVDIGRTFKVIANFRVAFRKGLTFAEILFLWRLNALYIPTANKNECNMEGPYQCPNINKVA